MHRILTKRFFSTTIKEVAQKPNFGESITINGWVSSVRRLKSVAFVDVFDGTCSKMISAVLTPEQSKGINTGSCVEVTGLLKEGRISQKFELEATKTPIILGKSAPDYPLQKKFHTPEFMRTIPQFRWKTTSNAGILRYRSYAQSRIARYFEDNHFTQVSSPILTSSDCEGAGEVFSVNSSSDDQFFGKKTYLSVSSQLHLEVYAAALSRVWNMTPTFRAEESDTNRHLSEFWMVEAEIAFIRNLEHLTTIAEQMVRVTVPRDEAASDLLETIRSEEKRAILQNRWEMLSKPGKWPRITYTEAIDILKKAYESKAQIPLVDWNNGLASQHEKYLASEYFHSPVFVTDYPTSIKPFYMKKSGENTVAAFDLLIPEMGELIGGSIREDDYTTLLKNMKDKDMNTDDLDWYLKLREYGTFPHGGFGMGFERLVCFICGIDNIRDAIGFPRWAKHIQC